MKNAARNKEQEWHNSSILKDDLPRTSQTTSAKNLHIVTAFQALLILGINCDAAVPNDKPCDYQNVRVYKRSRRHGRFTYYCTKSRQLGKVVHFDEIIHLIWLAKKLKLFSS